ncbi:protein piccolo-like [Lampris incognitus]|uniref:protein piccolo-like n=1 Tax=Lampris incognitus TaxID=2546036 RepID=UPI0024B620D1|nr:protein piccolo-like [Lampris incognitus]
MKRIVGESSPQGLGYETCSGSKYSRRQKYYGLVNQGATCYLNSVLQIFYMTTEFREAVERHCDENPRSSTIDRQLTKVFSSLKSEATDTRPITRKLGIDRVSVQRDAAEYFEKILRMASPEASKVFHGELRYITACSRCANSKEEVSAFWNLPIPLETSHVGDYSVMDGIDAFFCTTKLTGDNQMYCDSCDTKADATIECQIKTPPEALMLLLKRFDFNYDYMKYIKIDQRVAVSTTVQIPGDHIYELYTVVNHYGNLTGGHYTATIKPQHDDCWYEFNDSWVTQLDSQQFRTSLETSNSAYLLVYRKKKMHEADTTAQEEVNQEPSSEEPQTITEYYEGAHDTKVKDSQQEVNQEPSEELQTKSEYYEGAHDTKVKDSQEEVNREPSEEPQTKSEDYVAGHDTNVKETQEEVKQEPSSEEPQAKSEDYEGAHDTNVKDSQEEVNREPSVEPQTKSEDYVAGHDTKVKETQEEVKQEPSSEEPQAKSEDYEMGCDTNVKETQEEVNRELSEEPQTKSEDYVAGHDTNVKETQEEVKQEPSSEEPQAKSEDYEMGCDTNVKETQEEVKQKPSSEEPQAKSQHYEVGHDTNVKETQEEVKQEPSSEEPQAKSEDCEVGCDTNVKETQEEVKQKPSEDPQTKSQHYEVGHDTNVKETQEEVNQKPSSEETQAKSEDYEVGRDTNVKEGRREENVDNEETVYIETHKDINKTEDREPADAAKSLTPQPKHTSTTRDIFRATADKPGSPGGVEQSFTRQAEVGRDEKRAGMGVRVGNQGSLGGERREHVGRSDEMTARASCDVGGDKTVGTGVSKQKYLMIKIIEEEKRGDTVRTETIAESMPYLNRANATARREDNYGENVQEECGICDVSQSLAKLSLGETKGKANIGHHALRGAADKRQNAPQIDQMKEQHADMAAGSERVKRFEQESNHVGKDELGKDGARLRGGCGGQGEERRTEQRAEQKVSGAKRVYESVQSSTSDDPSLGPGVSGPAHGQTKKSKGFIRTPPKSSKSRSPMKEKSQKKKKLRGCFSCLDPSTKKDESD